MISSEDRRFAVWVCRSVFEHWRNLELCLSETFVTCEKLLELGQDYRIMSKVGSCQRWFKIVQLEMGNPKLESSLCERVQELQVKGQAVRWSRSHRKGVMKEKWHMKGMGSWCPQTHDKEVLSSHVAPPPGSTYLCNVQQLWSCFCFFSQLTCHFGFSLWAFTKSFAVFLLHLFPEKKLEVFLLPSFSTQQPFSIGIVILSCCSFHLTRSNLWHIEKTDQTSQGKNQDLLKNVKLSVLEMPEGLWCSWKCLSADMVYQKQIKLKFSDI